VAILPCCCRERPVPERRINRAKTMKTTERRAINWKSMRMKTEANSDSDDVGEGSDKDDMEPEE
jgi:hypothetical protein